MSNVVPTKMHLVSYFAELVLTWHQQWFGWQQRRSGTYNWMPSPHTSNSDPVIHPAPQTTVTTPLHIRENRLLRNIKRNQGWTLCLNDLKWTPITRSDELYRHFIEFKTPRSNYRGCKSLALDGLLGWHGSWRCVLPSPYVCGIPRTTM